MHEQTSQEGEITLAFSDIIPSAPRQFQFFMSPVHYIESVPWAAHQTHQTNLEMVTQKPCGDAAPEASGAKTDCSHNSTALISIVDTFALLTTTLKNISAMMLLREAISGG